jgi:hypothetical protein
MSIGSPVNYCKIVRGYEPTIEKFENLPLGISASIAPTSKINEWSVCLSGTPILNSCKESKDGKICDCGTVSIKNECGSLDVEFCFNLDVTSNNRPGYCVGVVIATKNVNNQYKIEVIGVTPNTEALVYEYKVVNGITWPFPTIKKIQADSTGYGYIDDVSAVGPCLKLEVEHPTCALVLKQTILIQGGCDKVPE